MHLKTKVVNYLVNKYRKAFKIFPVENDIIYFTSYYGQYNDSPKYISEAIRQKNKKIKIIWEISEKSKEKNIPQYIFQVKRLSIMGLYYRNRAKVIVGNQIGENSRYILSNENKESIIDFVNSFKKKEQLIVSTWHGTPLKKMGADTPNGGNIIDIASDLDVLILSDIYSQTILGKLFFYKMPIKLLGSPRNDILINGDDRLKVEIKKKLKLPLDKKLILFAPTYKSDSNNEDNIYRSGILHLENINFTELLKTLNKKFDGDWVFICRFHNHVANKVNWDKLNEKASGRIVNGNLNDDMAEYLFVSDILLTDTTSSVFDFALTKKPCFLFFPDYEHYNNIERGFYMDIANLPFPLSTDFEMLVMNIKSYSEDIYIKEIQKLLSYIGNTDDGRASEKVSELILEFMRNNK